MHRIDGYGATPDGLFTEGDPANSVPATDTTDAWANDLQENVCRVIEGAGIVLVKGDYTQLLKAIKILAGLIPSSIRKVVATVPVRATDRIVVLDATDNDVDLTFLSAAAANAQAIKVMRSRNDPGTHRARLLPVGGETLAGQASIELMPGEGFEYVPDGTSDYLQF